MALARPLPHWGVDLTSQSSMSWWNSWATSWNKHFYFFLIYQLSPKETFFLTVYWATFAIGTHYESPPLLLGNYSREKDVYFWALLSPLYPSSSGRVKSKSRLHKGKRICVGDVPLVLGLISSCHLKCKLSSEELTPVFKIDFEVLPCNWCLKFDLFDSCYRTWVPLILFKPIKDSS